MVSPKYGQDKIEDIIKEERKHVVQLTSILNRIKAS
jgi:rubrerythrin